VILAIVLAAARADARTATGYHDGEKMKVKVVEVGKAEAEVHTAVAFRAMAKAARKAGIELAIRSGFRSHAKQTKLYKEYRKGSGNLAARPGFSNHESGRALDLVIGQYKTYEWLQNHASTYGFHRTVPGEPWHWEYLGGYQPEPQRNARRASRATH
jgi:LAS superfamily LD-carboxypeptidase LdcB